MRRGNRVRHLTDLFFLVWISAMTGVALALLLVLAVSVAIQGGSSFTAQGVMHEPVWRGVWRALAGSLQVVGTGAVIAVPVGLGAGFYLSENAGLRIAAFIRATADGLAGVPSIVSGLIVFAAVVTAMHAFSPFAGGLALATLLAPTLTRAAEQALLALPHDLREGAWALGATRAQTLLRVVVPTAGRELVHRVLLALSRAMGETAPLLFTVLGASGLAHGPVRSDSALPLLVFSGALSGSQAGRAQAWGAGLTLLAVVFALRMGARLIGRAGAGDAA